jgi:two-component system sensor histidine kinase RegB
VFIAVNLLERTGARVAFANRPEGGARVTVRWPRPIAGAAR